jgi:predicted transcriptional regulator of viral defense system
MAQQSFAKTVLETLIEEARKRGGEVSVDELSCALFLQTRAEHKRMTNALSDLVKSGRASRVRQGVYAVASREREPDRREVMWRTLRMRKSVTVADLQEFAGVAASYAEEWLQMLARRGVVRRAEPAGSDQECSWRLIRSDLVEMPLDTAKAKRLRALRRKRKTELRRALDQISDGLGTVRKLIQTLGDDQ